MATGIFRAAVLHVRYIEGVVQTGITPFCSFFSAARRTNGGSAAAVIGLIARAATPHSGAAELALLKQSSPSSLIRLPPLLPDKCGFTFSIACFVHSSLRREERTKKRRRCYRADRAGGVLGVRVARCRYRDAQFGCAGLFAYLHPVFRHRYGRERNCDKEPVYGKRKTLRENGEEGNIQLR